MRACELLEPDYLVQMLKAVKHLSMNASLLEVLQNANAIEILVRILDEHSVGPHSAVETFIVFWGLQLIYAHRKSQTTYSKLVIIYVASTRLDRKKLPRLESYRTSNA